MSTAISSSVMTVSVGGNGNIYFVGQEQASLFSLLRKLGLKTIPSAAVVWTTVGCTLSVAHHHTVISSTITLSTHTPTYSTNTVSIPSPVQAKKNKKAFSHFEKKDWRDKWKHHSRRPGRSL